MKISRELARLFLQGSDYLISVNFEVYEGN